MPNSISFPDLADSPSQAKRSKLSPSCRGRVIQFEREALKFCGEKQKQRLLKHLETFKQIDCTSLPPRVEILRRL